MKILLCAATEMEIAPTIHFLTISPHYSINVLITGIGLMASTYSITKAVAEHRPDIILQAGIAGSLNKDLPIANVVVVKNETVGDIGVQEGAKFKSLFDMDFLNQNAYPFNDAKLYNNHPFLKASGLTIVNGVTVNEISTNPQRINYYEQQLNAQIETMEGAALHYVGLLEKIPFLQVRSISNFIGERNKKKWMMNEAITNLNYELQRTLLKLSAV